MTRRLSPRQLVPERKQEEESSATTTWEKEAHLLATDPAGRETGPIARTAGWRNQEHHHDESKKPRIEARSAHVLTWATREEIRAATRSAARPSYAAAAGRTKREMAALCRGWDWEEALGEKPRVEEDFGKRKGELAGDGSNGGAS